MRRWFQERPSEHPHEQEALDYVRGLMPKNEPYRAWATFTFTARSGRVNECDLLLASPSGLHLVEFKAHPGRVVNSGQTWRFHTRDRRILTLTNPLHLTDRKSKELRSQLQWAARELGLNVPIPRVEPSVFLTDDRLVCELDAAQRPAVYGRYAESGLPSFEQGILLASKPQPLDARFSQHLPKLLEKIGISQSQRHLRYGDADDWKLEPTPLDSGPTWEDRLARKSGLVEEEGRVRIYLVPQSSSDEARASVHRAALREYQVLQGITHPGIAQAVDLREHLGGSAILFRHGSDDLRLDTYLDVHGANLAPETRIGMIHQLAEALRYAHGRSLYHRALSARSVYVSAKADGTRPQLRIIDWQTAARDFDTSSGRSLGNSPAAADHIEDSAQLYLAPEFDGRYPDPVELDMFGLGALSYLILTGLPPAHDRATLLDLLKDGGLRPSGVADGVSTELDQLVHDATLGDVTKRIESADRFLKQLDAATRRAEEEAPVQADPLSAVPGNVIRIDGHKAWTVERVLGTGSTGRALLVSCETEDEEGERDTDRRVLKVAVDENVAADQLRKEAQILAKVGGGPIIRLLDGPQTLAGRTVLDLEYAGEQSLRAWLDTDGKLSYHYLSRFGEDLFRALDQLAGKGVRHRDLKPENLGVFQRVDRNRELKLFDFSHAAASDQDTRTGTRGYLDPFLGTISRPAFDDHAERYAAAVTLHEMATKERPVWGDGQTSPAVTGDDHPKVAAELFEPALRDGLTAFFQRAMHRDVAQRFDTLRMMEDAWREVFRAADAMAPIGSEASGATLEDQREAAAEAATLDTNLRASGLSPRAVSLADSFGASTVRELLAIPPHELSRARGAGRNMRRELLQRRRQWEPLLTGPVEPPPAPEGATDQLTGYEGRLGIDVLARLVAPPAGRRGAKGYKAVLWTLGLPADDEPAPPVWPAARLLADRFEMTTQAVYNALSKSAGTWFAAPWLANVRDELVAVLARNGGVMTAGQLTAAFRAARGGVEGTQEQALARATTVMRAAILAETWNGRPEEDEPRLTYTRARDEIFVSLESLPGTDDPTPSELVEYALALGAAADLLADADPLPGRSEVMAALRLVDPPEGLDAFPDERLLALAASASRSAVASPRLDLYPRDLDLVRALRISQAAAGAAHDRGIGVAVLLERLRARFPDLAALEPAPTYVELQDALRDAGFPYTYDASTKEFRPPAPAPHPSSTATGMFTFTPGDGTAEQPAHRSELNLRRALDEGGFVALTIAQKKVPGTVERLGLTHPVRVVDVTAVFLRELRGLAAEQGTDFAGLLRADDKYGRTRTMPPGLASYVKLAWERAVTTITELGADPKTVLLLHNAGLLARYAADGGHSALVTLQQAARRPETAPHGMWLLCPSQAPKNSPTLDGMTVEAIGSAEWSVLDTSYLDALASRDSLGKA
ncbi:BREX system serine/threonine kinase PglW [Actinocorallia aurea]